MGSPEGATRLSTGRMLYPAAPLEYTFDCSAVLEYMFNSSEAKPSSVMEKGASMDTVSIALRGGMVICGLLWEVGIGWGVVLTFCGSLVLTFCWCWRERSRRKTLLALSQEARKTLLALERERKSIPPATE
jgi:hypothetical protein